MSYRILALSYLFPNKFYPNYGIFVLNRLKHVAQHCEIKVVAPVPWFPFMERFAKFRNYTRIPRAATLENLDAFHPRFFMVPKFMKWLDGVSYFLSTLTTILRIRKDFDFDIIDLHWTYPDIVAGYLYSKVFRSKWIVTIRGKEAIVFRKWDLRTIIVNSLLRRADYVIALSEELAAMLRNKGVAADRISIIQNGVDVQKFTPMDKRAARRKLGLKEDDKIILSVGSLIARKGYHKVITAMPGLVKKFADLKYYIVGSTNPEGDFAPKLRKLISDFNLETRVFMVGARSNEELVYWYNSSDLFCLASEGEGSPNVVREALACGSPIVATDVGDVRQILSHSFLGYVVDPAKGNKQLADKLSLGLTTAWDKPAIRKHIQKFTWHYCAQQVIGIYQRL